MKREIIPERLFLLLENRWNTHIGLLPRSLKKISMTTAGKARGITLRML